jgi:hypothetical protein
MRRRRRRSRSRGSIIIHYSNASLSLTRPNHHPTPLSLAYSTDRGLTFPNRPRQHAYGDELSLHTLESADAGEGGGDEEPICKFCKKKKSFFFEI